MSRMSRTSHPTTVRQGYSFASGAALNSDAFIAGGATHGTSIARLRGGAWDALPSCVTPRLHSAVVACNGHLFVLVSANIEPRLLPIVQNTRAICIC